MICRNYFPYRSVFPVIIMLLYFCVLIGCTRERENPDESQIEKEINDAQKGILDIVASCVTDNFDADISMAGHIEAIKSNPVVNDVLANDCGIQVTYTDGETQCFIYDYGSIFDSPNQKTKAAPEEDSDPETRAVFDPFAGKTVHIFNLFSDDSSRANQNELVNTTAKIYRSYLGSSNVHVYGFRDFTVENLEAALKDRNCVAVHIYSFGLDQNIAIGGGYYKRGEMYAIKVDNSYAREYDSRFYVKMTPAGNYVSQMLSHDYYGVDIQAIISTKNAYDLAGKLIYLSSCNTLSCSFSSSINACVTGWDGVNKLGEAYGLIMTHYMVDRRRDLATFRTVFKNNGSELEDLYAGKGARFKVKGGVSNVDYWAHAGFTVPETRNRAKIIFKEPNNGGCIDTDLLFELGVEKNTKFRYEYILASGESIGMFESTHPGGFVYFVHGNNLKGDEYFGSPLDCKWSTKTTMRHFEPGVMRYELIQQSKADWDIVQHRDCSPDGDWNVQDAIYVITPKRFKENDAGQPTPPDVRSIAALRVSDKMYAYGGIVDMDGAGFRKGFSFWKKGDSTSSTDVVSEVDENLFYAALPGLKKGEEYTFKAYLVGPDGEYYWSEPYDFVSEVDSGIPTEPTAGDLIDLGLSVKWASCNLGAAEPQDAGDYYAWGETQTKSNYNWSTYLLSNGSSNSLKKYCLQSSYGTVDNRTTLDLTDDAAFVNTSGKMRMPTAEECRELRDNCQWTETQYKGRNGFLVYSATTGNAIFIPKNGLKFSYVLNTDSPYYWTADLGTDESFRAESFLFPQIMKWDRCDGLGIRPVSNSQGVDTPETETITVNGISFKMVKVDAGSFMMGSPDDDPDAGGIYSDEKPQHRVALSSYAIGETEVTQALWVAVMGYNPSRNIGDDRPVEEVSWEEAQSFVGKLRQLTGRPFRLPTEAEWEYAARGGKYSKGYKFAGGDDVHEVAWNCENSGWETHTVATKKPNELGLYDMSGNVWEWCEDWYENSYYRKSPSENPCNTVPSEYHIHRGGSFEYILKDLRIAMRGDYVNPPSISMKGLRLVLSDISQSSVSVPQAVDLGLSVRWASFNLGASTPEGYGYYYAWGETEPKMEYTWETYKWCKGSSRTLTKYCYDSSYGYEGFTDNKMVLDPEDDAAYVKLRGKWRMPTKENVDELWNNCVFEMISQNGVYGCRVTGPNGNSIFLPGTGFKSSSGDLRYEGSTYFIWSSSLSNQPDDAFCLPCRNLGYIGYDCDNRVPGYTIRPVYDDN